MTKDRSPKSRLGPEDWILAGFRALVTGGHAALRAEALARDIGATKGSFYWHFKDLRDFHQKMLEAWQALSTTMITEAVVSFTGTPKDRLLLLMDMVSVVPGDRFGGVAIEPAIRAWALADPVVQDAVMRVDRQRLADVTRLLQDAGVAEVVAEEAARSLYAMVIGFENLRLTGPVDMRSSLRQAALALLAGTE